MIKQFAAMMAATAVISAAAPVYAAPAQIMLEVSHSQILRVTNSKITRVAIANPAIADVAVFDKGNVSIIGVASGSTTLMVWTADGMRQDFTIVVTATDESTAQAIKAAMHLPDVEVELVGQGDKRKILLTGFVEDQNELELALSVAALYVDGEWGEKPDFSATSNNIQYNKPSHPKIINNIQVRNPIQVNLSIMVLDVMDNDDLNYGLKYGNASQVNAGLERTTYQQVPKYNADGTLAGFEKVETANHYYAGVSDIPFNGAGLFYGGGNWRTVTGKLFSNIDGLLQLSIAEGKTKVLSRPNATTLSGKEAAIMIGGEIPIPSKTKDGEVSVQWRDYGIKMRIKPTVDTNGKITTALDAEISSLDWSNAVDSGTGKIPAMTSRKVSTMVDVMEGQTMAIGGLVNNNDGKMITKIPILGDLPIIGEFFKHTTKTKDKRELVILIKPTLVKKEDSSKISVGEKTAKAIEDAKKEWSNRQTVDTNSIPDPNGFSKTKK